MSMFATQHIHRIVRLPSPPMHAISAAAVWASARRCAGVWHARLQDTDVEVWDLDH
jgi:hypothetical protein